MAREKVWSRRKRYNISDTYPNVSDLDWHEKRWQEIPIIAQFWSLSEFRSDLHQNTERINLYPEFNYSTIGDTRDIDAIPSNLLASLNLHYIPLLPLLLFPQDSFQISRIGISSKDSSDIFLRRLRFPRLRN